MGVSKYLKPYVLLTHVGQLSNVHKYSLGFAGEQKRGGGQVVQSCRNRALTMTAVGGDRRESSTKPSGFGVS